MPRTPPTAVSKDFGISFDRAFSIFLDEGDRSALVDYLLSRSNLPGPRANLELLRRFADRVGQQSEDHHSELWDLCASFVSVPQDKAFTGSPMEFIPMCGTVGFGALGASNGSLRNRYFEESMNRLKSIASDSRWRVRESVVIALQKMLSVSQREVVRILFAWVEPERWLQMRAVVAGIAEPPLLKEPALCHDALDLHRAIVMHVVRHLETADTMTLSEVMRVEPFRKLVQALEYSISVVVAADPDEGFPFLKELIGIAELKRKGAASDKVTSVIRRILKGNLKKKRLLRAFPEKVNQLTQLVK